MKVSLNEKGVLLIEAENGLEAYALRKWCDEHKELPKGIMIDRSAWCVEGRA